MGLLGDNEADAVAAEWIILTIPFEASANPIRLG
jgi:hypothetical protein